MTAWPVTRTKSRPSTSTAEELLFWELSSELSSEFSEEFSEEEIVDSIGYVSFNVSSVRLSQVIWRDGVFNHWETLLKWSPIRVSLIVKVSLLIAAVEIVW